MPLQYERAITPVYFLKKYEAHATLAFGTKAYGKFVAAAQGIFVVYLAARENEIVSLFVELSKIKAAGAQKLMARVFEVVLVYGVVDDALQIAFVVANG